MEFLLTIPDKLSNLPLKIRLEVSEEVFLTLNKDDWSSLNKEEKTLAVHRVLLKRVLKAYKSGDTFQALKIFSYLPEDLRKSILDESKESFSDSAIAAIQKSKYLKQTDKIQ